MRSHNARALVVALAIAVVFLVGSHSRPSSGSMAPLVGIWQQCYEPGLHGVSEIDTGYLVLMPGQDYVLLSSPLDSPLITETGRYEPAERGVILHPEKRTAPDGEPGGGLILKPRHLALLSQHRVVFWDERETAVTTDVLAPGPSADYGFARVPLTIHPQAG